MKKYKKIVITNGCIKKHRYYYNICDDILPIIY